PGYVGYDEPGQLTEQVRRRPYSVILLDEIEKAHADVFNLLLQVLEDGRLTDGQGRTVDFRNTVVLMTSNLGSEFMASSGTPLGFASSDEQTTQRDIEHKVMGRLPVFMRREVCTRIDDTLLFTPLDAKLLRQIVGLQLQSSEQGLDAQGISLKFYDKARDWSGDADYEPAYG